jgi:type IV pilus assembly protein PilE
MQSLATTAASRQSQFLVDRRRYASSLSALGINVPSPLSSKYTVAVAAADGPPPSYSITATAVGTQARDTRCATLVLDNAGNRTPAGCW